MTASASPVSLANRSLLSIGARAQISSLDENTDEASAINTLFVPTFEQLARTAPWNCLKNQATLTLLAAAQGTPENVDGTTLPLPPAPWLYSYALPSDCLQVRFILPTFPNSTPAGTTPLTTASNTAGAWIPGVSGQVPFSVSYGTDNQNNPITIILCNQNQAQCVYTVNQPNPIIWDSLFEAAFVAAMSAYLVPALSLNLELMKMSIATADASIQQARIRDGNEGATSQDNIPDWLKARASGTLFGYNNYNSQLGPLWQGMAWPAYG